VLLTRKLFVKVSTWEQIGNQLRLKLVGVFKVGRTYHEGVIYSYANFDVLADYPKHEIAICAE
jgi:hypothetical protein